MLLRDSGAAKEFNDLMATISEHFVDIGTHEQPLNEATSKDIVFNRVDH